MRQPNMTKILKLLALSALFLITISCQQKGTSFLPEYPEISLLITNGKVLDGLGNDPVLTDLVIVDDKIVYVGKTNFSATELKNRVKIIIDAEQNIVAPGFIDLHTHGDPLSTPAFENFLAMGVTTITLGQDGSSPKVVKLSDWLDKIDDTGIAVNLAMFVGHGTLRELTGINRTVVPGPDSLTQMLKMLDETLAYTFGMSTGLEYNPGLYAEEAE